MKLGMFMMPLHPPARPHAETLAEDAEKIVLADKLGFEEAFVGEHFSCSTEPIPAPLMFMASLLAQTKRIKFGTGVINIPNHHPAIVAAEAAMFDQLSRGRFIFGIGPGGLASDFELFSNQDAQVRGEKMIEGVQQVLKIWASDPPYDIPGKYNTIKIKDSLMLDLGVGYMPKPYQKPHPPIAMSAMSPFSGSVKQAAQRGWSPISANFIPTYSVKSHWSKYVEGCEAAKRPPTGADRRVARNVVVAATDSEAKARAFDRQGSNHYYFHYLIAVLKAVDFTDVIKWRKDLPDSQLDAEGAIEQMVIYGSPKTVAEKLLAFRDEVGPFGTLLMAGLDWQDANRAWEQESMRRLAEDVMPIVRKAVGAKAAE